MMKEESGRELAIKWLRILAILQLVSIVNTLIDWLPLNASVNIWISRLILAAMTVSMFAMAPLSGRYRKSAIYRAVWLACALFNGWLLLSLVLNLAASICSIFAVYEEYTGHGELIGEQDPRLAANWHRLFGWSILVSILTSLCTSVTVVLITMAAVDGTVIQTLVMILTDAARLAVTGFIMHFLLRTIRLLAQET